MKEPCTEIALSRGPSCHKSRACKRGRTLAFVRNADSLVAVEVGQGLVEPVQRMLWRKYSHQHGPDRCAWRCIQRRMGGHACKSSFVERRVDVRVHVVGDEALEVRSSPPLSTM